MTTEVEYLATFCAELTYNDLPETVRDRTRLVIADSTGVIIGGSISDAVDSLCDQWTDTDTDMASVYGTLNGQRLNVLRH